MDKMQELWILTKQLNTSFLENKSQYEKNITYKIEMFGTVQPGMG